MFHSSGTHAARLSTDDKQIHEQVVREVLILAKDLDMSQSPPVMGQKIHRLIRELVETEDPYRDVKKQFNNASFQLCSKIRTYIIESKDMLETAIRLVIAGNIINFGVNSKLQESELEKTISECLAAEFSDMQLKPFQQAINEAKEILYIADNVGEIIFDRLLIEQLPMEKVTVVVKGSPVINDATVEDAWAVGLIDLVEVIDTGDDAPIKILEICSVAFRYYFETADVVIAKGQGNYESLSDVDKNIFFSLKAKCPVIAEHLGCEVDQMILRRSDAFAGAGNLAKGGKADAWV